MYFDTVVVSGLVIVTLTCIMITYVGIYAYKHIKEDSAKFEREAKNSNL